MKYFMLFLAGVFFSLMACSGPKQSTTEVPVVNPKVEMATVTAVVSGCSNALYVYQFDGIGFKELGKATQIGGDTFSYSLPRGEADIFYFGQDDQQKRPVVVGPESAVAFSADCKSIRNANFSTSEWNKKYDEVISTMRTNKQEQQTAARFLQQSLNNAGNLKVAESKLIAVDQKKLQLVNDLQTADPFLAKMAALESYQSYASDKKNYPTEVEHYGKEYFSGVDLQDPVYNNITYLFESFREYATTLSNVGLSEEQIAAFIDAQLARMPATSRAQKYALGGVVLGLQSTNHPLFLEYGNRFFEQYKNEGAAYTLALGKQIQNARGLVIGGEAPDFTQNTPEGEPMSLSNFRGKVVLVDFWASWCGPCRRENPNVVRIYNKYKDKGFDVLGVSLDQSKAKWVDAIAADGLAWNHVSDLKGWNNEVAATYSVRSIPHTILLDQDGRIIARNLRGPQLEQQLEGIFGF